jgi:hypothetical protein
MVVTIVVNVVFACWSFRTHLRVVNYGTHVLIMWRQKFWT